MLKEKDILKNKYLILRRLGQGGMGRVWLAEDLELKKKWAVKEIDKSSAAYKNALSREGRLAEIEILNCLDSPFAPRIVDSFENEQSKCVIMDYIEGRTLASMLEDGTVPKDPEIIISWGMDLCSLFSYLHEKNIVYRDVKPANILLTQGGTVKVVDYGIAKFARPGSWEDETAVGTRGYAAPEQYRKISEPRSDIYSLCMTLYQLLSGEKKPEKLSGGSLARNRYRLPAGLLAILEKGCEKDPEKRFASMDALRNALAEYESFDGQRAAALKKKIRRFRRLKTAAAVCLTLGAVLFTAGVGQDSLRYKQLVHTDSSDRELLAAAYTEAAELKPYSPTACEKLLELHRAEGFSAKELTELGQIYGKYEKYQWLKTAAYAELSKNIALAWLCGGPEDADSEALWQAACPYLKNCCATKYADALAEGLFAMAAVKTCGSELTAENADRLLTELLQLAEALDGRIGKNVRAENQRLCGLTAEFLQDYAGEFAAAGLGKEAEALLEKLQRGGGV